MQMRALKYAKTLKFIELKMHQENLLIKQRNFDWIYSQTYSCTSVIAVIVTIFVDEEMYEWLNGLFAYKNR